MKWPRALTGLVTLYTVAMTSEVYGQEFDKAQVLATLREAEGAVENIRFSMEFSGTSSYPEGGAAASAKGRPASAVSNIHGLFVLEPNARYNLTVESVVPMEDGSGYHARVWSGTYDGTTVRETHVDPQTGRAREGIVDKTPLRWQAAALYRAMGFTLPLFRPCTSPPLEGDSAGLAAFLQALDEGEEGSWSIEHGTPANLLRVCARETPKGGTHVLDLDLSKGANLVRYAFVPGYGSPEARPSSVVTIELAQYGRAWFPKHIVDTRLLYDETEGTPRVVEEVRYDIAVSETNVALKADEFRHTFAPQIKVFDQHSQVGQVFYDVAWYVPWLQRFYPTERGVWPAVVVGLLVVLVAVVVVGAWIRHRAHRVTH